MSGHAGAGITMHEIRIPKLGLDTLECDIREWFVKPGDRVAKGGQLLEVESEKAVLVIEAEVGGTVRVIHTPAPATVAVGAVVGVIDEDLAAAAAGKQGQ